MHQIKEQHCSTLALIQPEVNAGGHLHRSQDAQQSLSIIQLRPYHDMHLLQLVSSASHITKSSFDSGSLRMHTCSRIWLIFFVAPGKACAKPLDSRITLLNRIGKAQGFLLLHCFKNPPLLPLACMSASMIMKERACMHVWASCLADGLDQHLCSVPVLASLPVTPRHQ